VTELTFLLFLKMLEETGKESRLPKTYRWGELAKREGLDQLDYYKRLLLDLGKPDTKDSLVRAIFTDAQTRLRKPTNLKALTASIDQLDWFSAREEGLGKLYEGLLEKNASDKKSGDGQYFTPRPLIDCIVRLVKPQAGECRTRPRAQLGSSSPPTATSRIAPTISTNCRSRKPSSSGTTLSSARSLCPIRTACA
jgi:type I restriction enzyme M protein